MLAVIEEPERTLILSILAVIMVSRTRLVTVRFTKTCTPPRFLGTQKIKRKI